MPRLLCFALLCFWTVASIAQVDAKRYPSGIPGVDLVLTYDLGPPATDYAAETHSSLPDTDPYVLSRGLELGLIRLVNEHSRQAKHFTVPRAQIRALIRIKYDTAMLDRTDLVFTRTNLILVHTASSNAGMFIGSDVYELPFISEHDVDKRLLTGKSELLRILEIGLAQYKGRP